MTHEHAYIEKLAVTDPKRLFELVQHMPVDNRTRKIILKHTQDMVRVAWLSRDATSAQKRIYLTAVEKVATAIDEANAMLEQRPYTSELNTVEKTLRKEFLKEVIATAVEDMKTVSKLRK